MQILNFKGTELVKGNKTGWVIGDVERNNSILRTLKYTLGDRDIFLPLNGEITEDVFSIEDLEMKDIKLLRNSNNRYRIEECIHGKKKDELLLFEIELDEDETLFNLRTDSELVLTGNWENKKVAVMRHVEGFITLFIRKKNTNYKVHINTATLEIEKTQIESDDIEEKNLIIRPDIVRGQKREQNEKDQHTTKKKIYVVSSGKDVKTIKKEYGETSIVLILSKERNDKKSLHENYIERNKNKSVYLFNTDAFITYELTKNIPDVCCLVEDRKGKITVA